MFLAFMSITHAAIAAAGTSLILGTASPLSFAAIALPIGYFLGNWLTAIALPLGHLLACFSDCFTKQGVQLFFPDPAWAISVSNPNRRIRTGSTAEYWVLVAAAAALVLGIWLATGGGAVQKVSQQLGLKDGILGAYNQNAATHHVYADIQGVKASDRRDASGRYFILGTAGSEFVVTDGKGIYKTNEQIITSKLTTEVGEAATTTVRTLTFNDESAIALLDVVWREEKNRRSAYNSYVVGMDKAIGDRAAIEFAVGFYDGLGAGRSVEFAYKLGCNSIEVAGIPEHLTPQLLSSPDILANRVAAQTEVNPGGEQSAKSAPKETTIDEFNPDLKERDMPSIFICYSHQDKVWRDRLLEFLKPLNDEEQIVWSDLDLEPGDMWDEKIKEILSQVTVAMVLVSQTLLNSRYVQNEELPRLLKRREAEGVRIIPLFVENSTVENVPFEYTNKEGIKQKFYLNQFQSPRNNSPNKPLCDLKKSGQDKVFVYLEKTLRSLIEESKKKDRTNFVQLLGLNQHPQITSEITSEQITILKNSLQQVDRKILAWVLMESISYNALDTWLDDDELMGLDSFWATIQDKFPGLENQPLSLFKVIGTLANHPKVAPLIKDELRQWLILFYNANIPEQTYSKLNPYLMAVIAQPRRNEPFQLAAFLKIADKPPIPIKLRTQSPAQPDRSLETPYQQIQQNSYLCTCHQWETVVIWLKDVIEQSENLYLKGCPCGYELNVELFVPFDYLREPIDLWKIRELGRSGRKLGQEYPCIVRSWERINEGYYGNKLQEMWKYIPDPEKNCLLDKIKHLEQEINYDYSELEAELIEKQMFGLTCHLPEDYERLFEIVLETGIPLTLWSRPSDCKAQFEQLLNNQVKELEYLIQAVFKQRQEAHRYRQNPESKWGYHLALLLDNPNRTPPSQFLRTPGT